MSTKNRISFNFTTMLFKQILVCWQLLSSSVLLFWVKPQHHIKFQSRHPLIIIIKCLDNKYLSYHLYCCCFNLTFLIDMDNLNKYIQSEIPFEITENCQQNFKISNVIINNILKYNMENNSMLKHNSIRLKRNRWLIFNEN